MVIAMSSWLVFVYLGSSAVPAVVSSGSYFLLFEGVDGLLRGCQGRSMRVVTQQQESKGHTREMMEQDKMHHINERKEEMRSTDRLL